MMKNKKLFAYFIKKYFFLSNQCLKRVFKGLKIRFLRF